MRLIRLITEIWRLRLARFSIKASMCLAMIGKRLLSLGWLASDAA